MNFSDYVAIDKGNGGLNFGGDPNHLLDPTMFYVLFIISLINQSGDTAPWRSPALSEC